MSGYKHFQIFRSLHDLPTVRISELRKVRQRGVMAIGQIATQLLFETLYILQFAMLRLSSLHP